MVHTEARLPPAASFGAQGGWPAGHPRRGGSFGGWRVAETPVQWPPFGCVLLMPPSWCAPQQQRRGSHALGLVSGSPASVTQVSLHLSRMCVSVKDSGSPSLRAGTSHLLAEPPGPPAAPALLLLAVHTPHPILSSACASSFNSSCLCDQLSTGRRPSLL